MCAFLFGFHLSVKRYFIKPWIDNGYLDIDEKIFYVLSGRSMMMKLGGVAIIRGKPSKKIFVVAITSLDFWYKYE